MIRWDRVAALRAQLAAEGVEAFVASRLGALAESDRLREAVQADAPAHREESEGA